MTISEAKLLRQREEENRRLKRIAELSLSKQMLEDVLSKKWGPAAKTVAASHLIQTYDVSD
jgi:hypothetical protein